MYKLKYQKYKKKYIDLQKKINGGSKQYLLQNKCKILETNFNKTECTNINYPCYNPSINKCFSYEGIESNIYIDFNKTILLLFSYLNSESKYQKINNLLKYLIKPIHLYLSSKYLNLNPGIESIFYNTVFHLIISEFDIDNFIDKLNDKTDPTIKIFHNTILNILNQMNYYNTEITFIKSVSETKYYNSTFSKTDINIELYIKSAEKITLPILFIFNKTNQFFIDIDSKLKERNLNYVELQEMDSNLYVDYNYIKHLSIYNNKLYKILIILRECITNNYLMNIFYIDPTYILLEQNIKSDEIKYPDPLEDEIKYPDPLEDKYNAGIYNLSYEIRTVKKKLKTNIEEQKTLGLVQNTKGLVQKIISFDPINWTKEQELNPILERLDENILNEVRYNRLVIELMKYVKKNLDKHQKQIISYHISDSTKVTNFAINYWNTLDISVLDEPQNPTKGIIDGKHVAYSLYEYMFYLLNVKVSYESYYINHQVDNITLFSGASNIKLKNFVNKEGKKFVNNIIRSFTIEYDTSISFLLERRGKLPCCILKLNIQPQFHKYIFIDNKSEGEVLLLPGTIFEFTKKEYISVTNEDENGNKEKIVLLHFDYFLDPPDEFIETYSNPVSLKIYQEKFNQI